MAAETFTRIRREIRESTPAVLAAYVRGSCHDGTRSRSGTTRIGQKDVRWVELLRECIECAGDKAWIYREGKDRDYWVVETSARYHERRCEVPDDPEAKVAFIRGYFDAEGGIPRSARARFYLQIAQKDFTCLSSLHAAVEDVGIPCGALHQPSLAADPNYWRFGVRAAGFGDFAATISSWHPLKRGLLDDRVVRFRTARSR